MSVKCHRCKGDMQGTTATFEGRWTCPACLYEIEMGKKPKPAPKPRTHPGMTR